MAPLTRFRVLAWAPLVWMVSNCTGPFEQSASTRPDHEVHSSLIREVVLKEGWSGHPDTYDARRPIDQVVVLDVPDPGAPLRISHHAVARLEDIEPATVASFEARRGALGTIGPLEGVGRYRLVDWAEIEEVFQNGWEAFYDAYPGSPGILAFSEVGFNADQSQAVVYMMHIRGGLWGGGTLYLLQRRADGWTVTDRTVVWIS